jgi:hypothetical protein
MRCVVLVLSLALGACATSKPSSNFQPTRPQAANAEFCRKLMADQAAVAARAAQVNGAAPSDSAVDESWRRSQQMCADLVRNTPQN